MGEMTINQVIKQFQQVFGDIGYEAQQFDSDKLYTKGTVIDPTGMTEIIPEVTPVKSSTKAKEQKRGR
jgi:hypothetical protein